MVHAEVAAGHLMPSKLKAWSARNSQSRPNTHAGPAGTTAHMSCQVWRTHSTASGGHLGDTLAPHHAL